MCERREMSKVARKKGENGKSRKKANFAECKCP